MFDEILQMVKDHLSNDPQVAAAVPPEQQEALHNEIANHIANNVQPQEGSSGGGLLGMLGSGNPLMSGVEGGLVSMLTNKMGLDPAASGAISAALPALLAKFGQKQA